MYYFTEYLYFLTIGEFMEFIFYDTNFGHKAGEFCMRRISDYHFITFFHTDYVYESGGKLMYGRAGDMMILPRGEIVYHGPTPIMAEGFINDWMYISGDDFIEAATSCSLPIGIPFCVGGQKSLSLCIEKIRNEAVTQKNAYKELCELYMRECLIEISRAYMSQDESNASEKLENLRREIARDPKRDWNLGLMAKTCGYSESRFSAIYRKLYSVSPISDLIKFRIDNAKSLLSYSTITVSDIAEEVGFSSLYYFSKYFKKIVGISPTEYRHKG